MEVINGYTLTEDWSNSSCGQTAKATKGGMKFLLKKYQSIVKPIDNGTLTKETIKINEKKFDDFVNRHQEINKILRVLSGPGGNIISPADEVIYGNHLVEASLFVPGAVKDEDLMPLLISLSQEQKNLLLISAAGALMTVHRKNIIHSDLKLKNILVVKTESGTYVAKLIDFDSSYIVGRLPEEVIGDINFYSPELGFFSNLEDPEDKEKYRDTLTTKSDIFSLGLVFHFYLTGEGVTYRNLNDKLQRRVDMGKVIYPWAVISSGGELVLSEKIKDEYLISLLNDMLSLNPEDRPDAGQVLMRIKTKSLGPKAGPKIIKDMPEMLERYEDGSFKYRDAFGNELLLKENEGELSLLKVVTFASKDFVLIDEVNGKTITSIGRCAFLSSLTPTLVKLNESLKSIDEMAFYQAINIEKIIFNKNISYIGNEAFALTLSLREIEIDSDVDLKIDALAFASSGNIHKVKILANNIEINKGAFAYVTNLESVKLKAKDTLKLDQKVFLKCNNIKEYVPFAINGITNNESTYLDSSLEIK